MQNMHRIDPEEKRVFVLPFSDLKNRYSDLGAYVADKLADELSDIEQVKILNRTDIELIKHELSFQQSGLVSEEDVTTLGRFSGANILITGTITDLGDELDVSVTFTAIEKGERIIDSFQIPKTRNIMSLIAAISDEEHRKTKEMEQKVAQLEESYKQRKREIEESFRKEEEAMKVELAQIEQEIREKSQILATLQGKKDELVIYDAQIEAIRQGIIKKNNLVEYSIMAGMRYNEVSRILGESFDIRVQMGDNAWEKVLGNQYTDASYHGNYVIVWSDFHEDSAVVIGCHNLVTGRTWRRLAE
ncbi:MAG: hypothetical protein FVQ79_12330 [Planctomycetes bacterium]|nr:hypothetical protein [Planctomycetota bacterium]